MSDCSNPWQRYYLILSNLSFLLPISYLIFRVRSLPVLELFAITSLMFASMLHHWCSEWHICGSECWIGFSRSYTLDFILSNMMFPLALTYRVSRSYLQYQVIVYMSYMIVIVILFNVDGTDDVIPFIILGAVTACIVLPIRMYHRIRRHSITHFFKKHFNVHALLLSMIFGGAALTFRILGDKGTLAYYNAHSLWHLFSGFMLYFALRILDNTDRGIWSFHSMDIIEMDDPSDPNDGTSSQATGSEVEYNPSQSSNKSKGYQVFIAHMAKR